MSLRIKKDQFPKPRFIRTTPPYQPLSEETFRRFAMSSYDDDDVSSWIEYARRDGNINVKQLVSGIMSKDFFYDMGRKNLNLPDSWSYLAYVKYYLREHP